MMLRFMNDIIIIFGYNHNKKCMQKIEEGVLYGNISESYQ